VMTTKRPRQSTTAKAKTNSREDTIRPIQQRAILLRARSKLLEAEGPRSLSAAARRAHKSREGGARGGGRERSLGAFEAKEPLHPPAETRFDRIGVLQTLEVSRIESPAAGPQQLSEFSMTHLSSHHRCF
jgi:hypothetical protein